MLPAAKRGQRLTGCAGGQVRIEGRPITSVLGTKSRFWAADGSAVGVEELALQYYATPEAGGWKGGRCSYPDLHTFTLCCNVRDESGRCSTCQPQAVLGTYHGVYRCRMVLHVCAALSHRMDRHSSCAVRRNALRGRRVGDAVWAAAVAGAVRGCP